MANAMATAAREKILFMSGLLVTRWGCVSVTALGRCYEQPIHVRAGGRAVHLPASFDRNPCPATDPTGADRRSRRLALAAAQQKICAGAETNRAGDEPRGRHQPELLP